MVYLLKEGSLSPFIQRACVDAGNQWIGRYDTLAWGMSGAKNALHRGPLLSSIH
jgi:hypothetical protein